MNEQVVAKKANLLFGLIVIMVFGVAVIALGLVFGLRQKGNLLIYLLFFGIVGLVMIASESGRLSNTKRRPST